MSSGTKQAKQMLLTLFRMGLFLVAQGWGEAKGQTSDTSYNDETWHSCTVPKE